MLVKFSAGIGRFQPLSIDYHWVHLYPSAPLALRTLIDLQLRQFSMKLRCLEHCTTLLSLFTIAAVVCVEG